jgi:internalin A
MKDGLDWIDPKIMTPEQAYAEALRRIEAAAESGQHWLDLGDLQLDAMPPEIARLRMQLTDLGLGDHVYRQDQNEWDYDGSRGEVTRTLTNLSFLRALDQLQILILMDCGNLADDNVLEGLHSLTYLEINDCSQLTDLAPICALHTLQSLRLFGCTKITNIAPISELRALLSLDLSWCEHLTDLAPIAELHALQSLDLTGCEKLTDISSIEKLHMLQSLDLSECERITDITPIAKLYNIQSLRLSGCVKLNNIAPIAALRSLQSLDLSWCEEITDFAPIAKLHALQSLDLFGCERISDLEPIAKLHSLRSLDLSGIEQLTDLAPIAKLQALQSLRLSGFEQLTDLAPIAELHELRSIHLSGFEKLVDLAPIAKLRDLRSIHLSGFEQITNITPIAKLSELQSLTLYWCKQLIDLTPIANLHSLKSLRLSGFEQLTDLAPIAELHVLESLHLSGFERLTNLAPISKLHSLQSLHLSGFEQLTNLASIANLHALQSLRLSDLEKIIDVSPIANLHTLQSLHLSNLEQLKDIASIAKLHTLHSLHITNCVQVSDVSPMTELLSLKKLDLAGCERILDLTPLNGLHRLESLGIRSIPAAIKLHPDRLFELHPLLQVLFTDQLHATPPEILSKGMRDNCLPRLRNWWQDLQQGEADTHEIKLFILGNGRVGKTQLFRRLRGEAFVRDEPSTHGIQLGRFALSTHDDGRPIFLNVWDFGGQDIYLGTHALFLQSRAIFVLAWHPEHESDAPYTETMSGLPMRHRPLRYWLDYIHSLAGRDAPLVVVQTRCERERDARVPELVDSERFDWLKTAVSCASRDDGVDELRGLLKRAARYRLEQQAPPRLPTSWLRVRDRLAAMRTTCKSIDLKIFNDVCTDIQGSAVPSALLHYLHQAGDVFHREGLFKDAIVLDQQWALDAIYSLFQREGLLPLLHRQRGMFAPALLGFAGWDGRYTAEEQALLRSMMESCHLIFPVHRWNDGDALYAMPDALPLHAEVAEQLDALWPTATVDARATLHYGFLHDGILRRFLSEVGHLAGPHALYWRHGVCFHDANTRSRACIDATVDPDGPGMVSIEVCGSSAQELCGHIVKMFEDIRIGGVPRIERDDGESGASSHDPAEDAREPVIAPAPIPLSDAQKPIVYLSYAWGGKARPELKQFAVELESSLQADFDVRRDERATRSGDRISEFMREIGRGARVLVLLSDPYLRSPNCMRELLHLYHRHLENAHDLRKHVLPLILDADLTSTAKQRLGYVKFWKQRLIELKEETAGLDPVECLPTHHEMAMIEEFRLKTEDMLIFLDDILMPRGIPYLSENDFSAVKAALGRLDDIGRY